MLTYAIGDVHGCADLLREGISSIQRHRRGREIRIVLLGDYVDRGPDTRATLDILCRLKNNGRLTCLRGNHEDLLLRNVHGTSKRAARVWLENGGATTLTSYGLDPEDASGIATIPKAHIDFLSRLPSFYESPEHVFVHAGLDPSRTLHEQGSREFLWIRDSFLEAEPDDFVEKRHIVHGHTSSWEGKPEIDMPEFLPHRTNLDTTAYKTGLLSIGVFSWGARGPVDLLSIM